VATKSKKAETPESQSKLKKQVSLPAKGKLAKKIAMPRFLRAIGAYFAGSWQELRQVRWPTRKATWSLTAAVLVFSVVLAVFILALDFGFEQLFKRIIL